MAGSYTWVAWDEIGDLSLFSTEDDAVAAFREAFGERDHGHKATITSKRKEL
ncbi:hypothetical protein [Gordonia paraffinivorans]|uniref:hypothetical protein n=1 Tax=Gordonia paraffinivorans TaxID=175628 RepID=UPI001447289F|nr:hypothetical protein [Gordonia paraffinivorans]